MSRTIASNSLRKTGALLASAALLSGSAMPISFAFADEVVPEPIENGNSDQGNDQPAPSYPEHAQLVETVEMDAAERQLLNAKEEHAAVQELYEQEKASYEAAKAEYDAHKTAADDAEIAATNAELEAQRKVIEELEAKAAEAEKSTKELEDARAEAEKLIADEENAKNEADAASEALLKAQEKYDAISSEIGDNGAEKLLAAKAALDEAGNAYADAVQAEKDAQTALANAAAERDNALDEEVSAKAALEDAEVELSDAQNRYDDAQTEYNVAAAEYEKVADIIDTPEYAAAEAAVKAAQDRMDQAQSDIEAAQSKIAAQEDAISKAESQKEELESALVDLEAEQLEAAAAVSKAKDALDTATSELDTAQSESDETIVELEKAAAEREQAQAAYNQAVKEKEEADQKLSETHTARVNAENKVKELETAAAAKIYDAWDFFASLEGGVGADAVKVLDLAPKRDHMSKGDPNDATSLSNMKESIQWLKRCNEIRASIGLSALQVNYTLMAMAQVNASYSASYTNSHSKQFNIGENLAWSSYDNGYDPFDGWYYHEKAIYDEAAKTGTYNGKDLPSGWQSMSGYQLYQVAPELYQNIGHYLNIIDPSYNYAGYAVSHIIPDNAVRKYKNTHSQTFSGNPVQAGYNKNLPSELTFGAATKNGNVSVEQYEKVLDAYIAKITQEDPVLTQAKAALKSACAAYDEAMKAADKKASIASSKQIESDAAETKYAEAMNKNNAAVERLSAAISEMGNARTSYENAMTKQHENAQAIDEKQGQINAADSRISEAEATKEQLEQELSAAQEEKGQASSDYENAVQKREELFLDVEDIQMRYDNAKEMLKKAESDKNDAELKYGDKEQEYVDALQNFESATGKYDEIEESYNSITAALPGFAQTVETCNAEYTLLSNKMDTLANAEDVLNKAKEERSEKSAAYEKAAADVVAGQNKVTETDEQNKKISEAYETAKGILVWEAIKENGTGGAYIEIDNKISDMKEAAAYNEEMKENLKNAQAIFAPFAASFATAQVHMDAANTNLEAAQKIYDDAVDWNEDYVVLNGDNATYTFGCGAGLGFRFSGPVDRFVQLLVDGAVVDVADYTVRSGSTIVTLSADYMNTLAMGHHTISAVYANGDTADAEFDIIEAPKVDEEGNNDKQDATDNGDDTNSEDENKQSEKNDDKNIEKDSEIIEDDSVPASGTEQDDDVLVQTGDDAASLFAGTATMAVIAGTTALTSCIGARRRR